MKKIVRKNQIIITALAVMIVVAGYLNFTGQEISTNGLNGMKQEAQKTGKATVSPAATDTAQETEEAEKKDTAEETGDDSTKETLNTDISAEDAGEDDYTVSDNGEVIASQENPGEAVMVSNTIGADYFASAKLSREQTRAKNKETLMEIVNSKTIASEDKKAAVKEVAEITANAEKESAAEMMLQAKGFEEAMVSISDGSADVVINAEELTNQQMAQVIDIVKRKTGISAEKIVITPVSVKEK